MKIAYFIGSLNRGGLENLVLDVCRQHDDAQYQMICVYRHGGNMTVNFQQSGVPLIHVDKEHGILRHLWNLRKVLLCENVDIVHSQSAIGTILLAFALIGTRIKIITSFHGNLFADASWWKRELVYKVSKKIICVSEYQKDYYEQKWHLPKKNKLQVVYNGIDFSKIERAQAHSVLKEKKRCQLAMVGNFIKGRSQVIIVKAVKFLKEIGNADFDLFFIGRRDELETWRYDNCVQYCEEHHLDNIHFLGSRGDVPELLKTMDGFVYSTEHDTFGIAVIEAIAAGLPIVVNDWPVMKEVCNIGLPKDNNAIRFFKTDDVEDCAKVISALLQDLNNSKSLLSTYCNTAANAVKQKYSIQKHIENVYNIYVTL